MTIYEIIKAAITMKCLPLRRFFYGDSAIIIKDGVLDQKKLRSLRVTGPDLLEVLRGQQIFDINDVAYAILETNGNLSVMLKSGAQNVTVDDLNGRPSDSRMPCLVISDGRFIKDSLSICKVTKDEIESKLRSEKIKLKDVFIMTCDSERNYNIIKKETDR